MSSNADICWNADGVIGIGITATAVGLIAGGIAAALARKKWPPQHNVNDNELPQWHPAVFNFPYKDPPNKHRQ